MKTETHEKLPESLCFEVDGHVSDVVLACLADGEAALLPFAATAHVDACDACTARLGAEALLSVGATDALLAAASESLAPSPIVVAMPAGIPPLRGRGHDRDRARPSSRRRRPLPVGAIAAALVIAVLGALPGMMDSLRDARAALPGYVHALPIWSHALNAVMRSVIESRSGVILRWTTVAGFIVMGVLVARAMTRKQTLEGGLG